MIRSISNGIHRRRSRKISLRNRRSTRRLRLGELHENVLERAGTRHDRTRVEAGRRERAVDLGPARRIGDDVETSRRLPDLLDAKAAQDLGGAGLVVDDDLEVVAAASRDLGDRAARDELALLDDQYAVADLLDLVQEMAREEHAAVLAGELANELANLALPRRIQAVRRLVEDHESRICEKRRRDAEPLPHTERVRPELRPAALSQSKSGEQGVDPRQCATAP